MKDNQRKTFGVEFSNPEPETAEEYDKLAKKVGACVSDANNQVFYHSQASSIRGAVVDLLEAHAGGRKQRTEKRTKDGKEYEVVIEKDADYVESAIAEGWLSKEDLIKYVKAAAKDCPFDPSTETREGKPKKLAQEYLVAATQVYDQGKAERFAKKYGVTLTGNKEQDIDLMGWALREKILADQRAQVAKALAGV